MSRKELDRLVTPHQVEWEWVRGHSGHPENERVDRLANQAIMEMVSNQSCECGAAAGA